MGFIFWYFRPYLEKEMSLSFTVLECENIFKLAVNSFIQRTWTIQKHEIFMGNYLPTESPTIQRAQMENVQLTGQAKI